MKASTKAGALLVALLVTLVSCVGDGAGKKAHEAYEQELSSGAVLYHDAVEHNDAGGYEPACGELPGMLGDDC